MTGPRIERCPSDGAWVISTRGCPVCGWAATTPPPAQKRALSAAEAEAEAEAHRGALAAAVAEMDAKRRPSGRR